MDHHHYRCSRTSLHGLMSLLTPNYFTNRSCTSSSPFPNTIPILCATDNVQVGCCLCTGTRFPMPTRILAPTGRRAPIHLSGSTFFLVLPRLRCKEIRITPSSCTPLYLLAHYPRKPYRISVRRPPKHGYHPWTLSNPCRGLIDTTAITRAAQRRATELA